MNHEEIRNEHKFPKRNKERKEIIIKKLFTTTLLCKISSAFNDLKKSFKEETPSVKDELI
jgi:hypothetical protein